LIKLRNRILSAFLCATQLCTTNINTNTAKAIDIVSKNTSVSSTSQSRPTQTQPQVSNTVAIQESVSLSPGQSISLLNTYPQLFPNHKATIIWTSSDTSVLITDSNGTAKAISPGSAVISAEDGRRTIKWLVTVKSPDCSYCCKDGHTMDKCPSKAVSYGASGRWLIPDVGVNVAVYPSNSQSIVDAKDSAGMFQALKQTLIADHNYQGFSAIRNCKPGTIAYLDNGKERCKFICTGITTGQNLKSDLVTKDNVSVSKLNVGGFTCYTCNENKKNVTIVFFQPA